MNSKLVNDSALSPSFSTPMSIICRFRVHLASMLCTTLVLSKQSIQLDLTTLCWSF